MAAHSKHMNWRIEITRIGLSYRRPAGKEELEAEAARNLRYRWLGPLSHSKTRKLLASSEPIGVHHLEDGGEFERFVRSLGFGRSGNREQNTGADGHLGRKISRLVWVGDTKKLRALLLPAEADAEFYQSLKQRCTNAAKLIQPKREMNAWRRLLNELGD